MQYMPGTPWSDPLVAELEFEMAAGRILPAAALTLPARPFLPIPFLVSILAMEFLLVSLVLWLD